MRNRFTIHSTIFLCGCLGVAAVVFLSGTRLAAQADSGWRMPEPPPGLAPEAGRRFRVDVLTVDPGDEPYSAWGHTGLRIYDVRSGLDFAFDFGLFQFDELFLARFLQGQPAYLLGAGPLHRMLRTYRQDNRRIYAQRLLISDAEAEKLLRRLVMNAQPENRTYFYNHYLNNCTTKIRDIIDEDLLGRGLAADTGTVPSEWTFRTQSSALIVGQPLYWLAVNLIQGAKVDRPISKYEEMFLPLDFMRLLDEHRKNGHADRIGPIVIAQDVLFPREATSSFPAWVFTGMVYCMFVLMMFGLPAALPEQRMIRGLGRVSRVLWQLGAGFTGMVLLVLWFGTNHESLDNNVNVLAYPAPLFFMPLLDLLILRKPQYRSLREKLYLGWLACPVLGILLVITTLTPQISGLLYLGSAAIIQLLIYLSLRRRT